MPDTLPERRFDQAISLQPIDGYVVVSRFLQDEIPGRPPQYSYEHYMTLSDAEKAYGEIERGEYPKFREVGIFAAKNGMPIGGRVL